MPVLRIAALASAALTASAVTPVEKVVSLLAGLKGEVEQEGRDEAVNYDKFACFCKDSTKSKSDSILAGRDSINSLSAEIAEKTASEQEKQAELKDRKEQQEAMAKELRDTQANFARETAEYEAHAADLAKAIRGLENAIKAMGASKPVGLLEVRKVVQDSLAFAEVLSAMPDSRRQALRSFLQVDPSDAAYKYHSHGIIETLQGLLGEFGEDKRALDSEWAVTKRTYQDTIVSLGDKMQENANAMEQLDSAIEMLKGAVAAARESLISSEATLKDDQLYMKDLTQQCETRAKDWDQRSQMRADELGAISKALDVLKGTVQGLDQDVNQRAMLLQQQQQQQQQPSGTSPARLAAVAAHGTVAAPSLLQEVAAVAVGRVQLRGGAAARALSDKAAALLSKEGTRLGSAVLSQLAAQMRADPFAKVKDLVQKLVERLLAESTAEATKKGFCDEQLGKAKKDRDYRLADSRKLDVEVQGLEIKLSELAAEIEELTGDLSKLRSDLTEATDIRTAEHNENLDVMKKGKEGEAAVDQAIFTLKVFYKQAAKAAAASLVQASPVDEDTAGAGFSGSYSGKQQSSKGIIGLLQVIKSDFDRTQRATQAAEEKAQEEFVEFDRASRADIGGKETKKALNEEDAETTKNTIASKMDDLSSHQRLLDGALKRLEDLKPTCIDTGMSYQERVAKREEEIDALKRALCMLDTDGVEDCSGVQV